MEREDIIRSVVEAAGEFHSRRLWEWFTNFDCFAVRIADRNESMLGVVLGAGGDEYGLSLFRGPQAAASFAALVHPGSMGDDALEGLDMLGFDMEAFRDLPPENQALLLETGRYPRHDEQAPRFLAKPPGRRPRLPDESELTLLLMILRAVVDADKKKLLQPTTLDDADGICVLALSGEPTSPQVSMTREKWQPSRTVEVISLPSDMPELKGLSRLKATWLVSTPTLSAGVKGDDRAMQLLLIADDASEYILQAKPVFTGDLDGAIGAMMETFAEGGMGGRRGLPRKIVFSNRRLCDAMTAILEPLGVRCIFTSAIPKLRAIADEFLDQFNAQASPFADEIEEFSEEEVRVPASDDLAGWKAADQRLARRLAQCFQSSDRLRSSRAVKRYFGDDDLERYFKEHMQQAVVMAYTAWGILDYRPNKTSKTEAEKMLEEGLPAPEAILLQARMEAYPTLYRVAGHNPKAGTIDLEDVLLGGAVTVHDQLMSENIDNGVFLCARAVPAGRFHFIEPAGPPLGPAMGTEAVEFLRDRGMEFSPESLRRDAHKFGWLWRWSDQWHANWKMPRLCNTDGDDLLWHTASFSVADTAAARQALLQRPDIDYDDQEDEFIWTKETGKGAEMLGGPVTLGRIEFVGDELVLTVNSAKRFIKARKWLEKLPRVSFRDVKTRPWDEAQMDRPLDERISPPERVEMTPEMAAALQDMLDKQYMRWIDTPLPVLGGKTPREACQTETGRQQVTMLIRTMPEPMGPTPIRAPRRALLRELGLTTEPASSPPADSEPPIPIKPLPPARKVGRNDPCPCGSGHKYKKCCGR